MTGRYVPVIHLPVRSSFSLTCSVLLLSPLANFLLLWRAARGITMRHAFPPTGGKGGRKCAVPSVAHAHGRRQVAAMASCWPIGPPRANRLF